MLWIFDTFKYLNPKQEHGIKTLYVALLILALHSSLTVFVHSSFLAQFFSDAEIGYLYFTAALLSIFPLYLMTQMLKKLGNFQFTIILSLLEAASLLGMAFSQTAFFAAFFFVLNFIVIPLLFFNLDVFIETIIGKKEERTGSARGLYLALFSITGAIAPLLAGYLIDAEGTPNFAPVYIASALVVLPFIGLITLYFKNFKDPSYQEHSIRGMIHTFLKEKDMRHIFCVQFLMHCFFAWMVIYTPMYLANTVGFTWTEIGYILFVGLFAYVIFEYPIGIIADKYIGEKEMMAFGFLVIAVSTSWLAFLPPGNIVVWMVAMFITRVGASFVEATSESYFFKHAQGEDTDKMSLFRLARPLSLIIIPLMGGLLLTHVSMEFTFILLALCMVPGIFITLLLKDTR